jgi:hypothetical protein
MEALLQALFKGTSRAGGREDTTVGKRKSLSLSKKVERESLS